MTFFNEEQVNTGASFEAMTEMEPIPHGTSVKAMIDDAKMDEYDGERYINLRWTILAPESFNNRKIFHKVKVFNSDSKKADKAKRMLVAIDANAGGKLIAANQEPDDALLQQSLLNKPMVIKLGEWEIKEEDKRGNWVMAVSAVDDSLKSQVTTPEPTEEMPF